MLKEIYPKVNGDSPDLWIYGLKEFPHPNGPVVGVFTVPQRFAGEL
jgi:hypothetical protein